MNNKNVTAPANTSVIAGLTYAMFFIFAMTTDAVGEIIRIAKTDMSLSNTEASAFHWATMVAIAASGIGLGFLADRFGRKPAIIMGLGIYMVASAAFAFGQSFSLYFVLLFISGIAIGIFKSAALALISDISSSTHDHTSKMNMVEGFFGVGAIIGPMLVVFFTSSLGVSWTWLYVLAASLCAIMIVVAAITRYPTRKTSGETPASLAHSLSLLKNPYALGFSFAIAMYVACEVAIFVWMPTLLEGFEATGITAFFAAYSVMIFFILRAAGRFMGAFILRLVDWTVVILVFTGIILACFLGSVIFGREAAVLLLPLSGLFMSMIYPTLNSKGISCFPKNEHGAVAGLILFFTAVSAALGPLLMAYFSDLVGGGDMVYGFYLATGFALVLFLLAIFNSLRQPAKHALESANELEYV